MLFKINGKWKQWKGDKNNVKMQYKDSFDVDQTLAPIIAECVKNYRKVIIENDNFGTPQEIVNQCKDFEEARQKWIDILDKIIYAFDSPEPEYEGDFIEGPEHRKQDGKFIKWDMQPTDLQAWERYQVETEEYWVKKQEGFELFGKHYQSLWW